MALGQLLRNDMFEEAEPEFQQLAFFRTRICKYHHLTDISKLFRNLFHAILLSIMLSIMSHIGRGWIFIFQQVFVMLCTMRC